ncbi:hypothetical protein, partial [Segatella salivae]|uniref:hypothetical protein n=1 Tax=Segatella salivae TaxID=228604 RepID=UPI002150E73D
HYSIINTCKGMKKRALCPLSGVHLTIKPDILVFNCYLCHVRFLLTCYVCSTKIGEISDISKCFEDIVSQALGVLTRIYATELRSE